MSKARGAAALLADASLVVVKVGSALLVDEQGQLREDWLADLVSDLATLKQSKQQVIVVSSGAVALGRAHVASPSKTLSLPQKQAAAAVGQIRLAQAWRQAFAVQSIDTAQLLLTPADTEDRRRHLNARATIAALLAANIVPVINENDTVATDEIRYGDNDRLAARVAQMAGASLLVLLTDVDGVFDADPTINDSASLIEHVSVIDEALMALAGDSAGAIGSGGMRSKLQAARIASNAGCAVVITSGRSSAPLAKLSSSAPATVFEASDSVRSARKRWILASLRNAGILRLDEGALAALRQGRSLLAVGVRECTGDFERGDCVSLLVGEAAGQEVGVGLIAYDGAEIRAAMAVDAKVSLQLIHRDDLVLFDERQTLKGD